MSAACRAAKISRSAYYDWYANDPEFAARVNDAIEDGTDRLEDSAARQAIAGNAALMTLLLKARRPDRYKDSLNLTGNLTSTVQLVGISADDV